MTLLKKFFVFACLFAAASAPLSASSYEERREIAAKVYGKIFFTQNQAAADYRVFVTQDRSFADLYVRKVPALANEPGEWEITEFRPAADWEIYITQHVSEADFFICYVNSGEGVH